MSPSLQLQPSHSSPPLAKHPADPLRASWNKVTDVAPFRWNRKSQGIDSGIPILCLMISFLITSLIVSPQRKPLLAQHTEQRRVDYYDIMNCFSFLFFFFFPLMTSGVMRSHGRHTASKKYRSLSVIQAITGSNPVPF